MRVIDGMHRLRAAILNGHRSIAVKYFDGSDEEAFIRAVEENIAHGLPLTLADRKDAAARILGAMPELSDRSAAAMTGLSPKTVGAIRACPSEEIPRMDARQGRDGRLRPLDSSKGRLRAAEAIRKNPGASLREVAAATGISPETVRSVKAQLQAAVDPARNEAQPSRSVQQPVGNAGNAAGSSPTSDTSASGPRNRPPTDEINSILQQLSRDPALRHSEAGRRLLQTLYKKAVDGAVSTVLMRESPPHSRPLLARLARYNAKIWKEIANELDKKSPTT